MLAGCATLRWRVIAFSSTSRFCLNFRRGYMMGEKLGSRDDKNSIKRSITPGDWHQNNSRQKRRKKLPNNHSESEGTHEEVLRKDLAALLLESKSSSTDQKKNYQKLEMYQEIEVTISHLSSTGDGLAMLDGQMIVVPFTLPGDQVVAKLIRPDHYDFTTWTADLVRVILPSPDRNDELVKCKYFASCSGCQFQMLSYSNQLAHKKRIVEKAFKNFSHLPSDEVPAVKDTIGSPLQYSYRTKLTPHFDGPLGGRKARRKGEKARFAETPAIGFMKKGTRRTLDIEECPIGTSAVQMGLRSERARVSRELEKYSRGATILLRESTKMVPRTEVKDMGPNEEEQIVYEDGGKDTDTALAKTCINDNNGTSMEYVDEFRFENRAGSFFQNNNSILPTFVSYIREQILPGKSGNAPKVTNLIDAYCGSGLFTITLSSLFERSIGIDIDPESIAFARRNAEINGLVPAQDTLKPEAANDEQEERAKERVQFIAATASALFESVADFDPAATAVVIDPPRKGCDDQFLKQLLSFKPARIVYVSCNVHTQARDIGKLLSGTFSDSDSGPDPGSTSDPDAARYKIESLVGFDFFPQTAHVEGVAVLSLSSATN